MRRLEPACSPAWCTRACVSSHCETLSGTWAGTHTGSRKRYAGDVEDVVYYELDLATWEERVVAQMLVVLAVAEPGENLCITHTDANAYACSHERTHARANSSTHLTSPLRHTHAHTHTHTHTHTNTHTQVRTGSTRRTTASRSSCRRRGSSRSARTCAAESCGHRASRPVRRFDFEGFSCRYVRRRFRSKAR